jgi:N-acetylmuramoyl-L-alanine amidase
MKKLMKKFLKYFYAAVVSFALIPALTAAVLAEADLRDKAVILDPGHGMGNSPGYESYNEAEAMLKLALKIKTNLESRGVTVYMTRSDKYDVELPVRAALVNKWAMLEIKKARPGKAGEIDKSLDIMQKIIGDYEQYAPVYMNFPFDYDYQRKIHPELQKIFELENDPVIRDRFLFISLHSNATNEPINTSINGATAFYISNSYEYNAAYYKNFSNERRSFNFGDKILDNIEKLGIKKLKAEPQAFFVIREHNVPAVLVEHGFHTNEKDRAKLSDDAFLDKLALAYLDTIIEYFTGIELSPDYQLMENPEKYQMYGSFSVYRNPGFASDKIADFTAQTITVHAKTIDGWGLISTVNGRYWAYAPEYQILEAPEEYMMPEPFAAYKNPDTKSGIIAKFSPQTVKIYAKTADGWGLIPTIYGKYWVYIG